MKKLMMIAAVVVAASAFADDYQYTGNVTLKTTVGKANAKVTANLGVDDSGDFWYEDSKVTNLSVVAGSAYTNALFGTKTIDGKVLTVFMDDAVAANPDVVYMVSTNAVTNSLRSVVLDLANDYCNKSAKKWCATYQWTSCYRVAGSKKYKINFDDAQTCDDTFTGDKGDFDFSGGLMHHFGAASYKKAGKVEVYGQITLRDGDGDLYCAGQGTLAWSKNDDEWYIKSISGNAVGVLAPPSCPNCCSAGDPAIAFTCGASDGDDQLDTAAYGTFTFKLKKVIKN